MHSWQDPKPLAGQKRQQDAARKEKIPMANEELANLTRKKEGLIQRKKELQSRKIKAQAVISSLEFEALEFRLALLESPDSDAAKKDLAEQRVRLSTAQYLEPLEAELISLEKQEDDLHVSLAAAKKSKNWQP